MYKNINRHGYTSGQHVSGVARPNRRFKNDFFNVQTNNFCIYYEKRRRLYFINIDFSRYLAEYMCFYSGKHAGRVKYIFIRRDFSKRAKNACYESIRYVPRTAV